MRQFSPSFRTFVSTFVLVGVILALPVSAQVVRRRVVEPVGSSPIVALPDTTSVLTAPIAAPVVTPIISPIVQPTVEAISTPVAVTSPSVTNLVTPVVTPVSVSTTTAPALTQILTPVVTPILTPTIPERITAPALTPATPLVASPATSTLQRLDSEIAGGSPLIDPLVRAKALLKSAKLVTIKYANNEKEGLSPSHGNCGWLNCADRYWSLQAYVGIRTDDPYFQRMAAMSEDEMSMISPGGIWNMNLRKTTPKMSTMKGELRNDLQVFQRPIPVLPKGYTAVGERNYYSLEQALGFDGIPFRFYYTYTNQFGQTGTDSYTVPALEHGQKFYIKGTWQTSIQTGGDEINPVYTKRTNVVCSPVTSSKAKKVSSRLQVWYGDKQLPQTIERYKDGTCAAVYLIP